MRTSIDIGQVNQYGVSVVAGPYLGEKRGNSTKWDFQCPVCNGTFIAPTTNFRFAKSCYSCRGKILRSHSEDTTWDYLYHVVKGRKVSQRLGFGMTKECFRAISKMNCYYCDSPPTITNGGKSWHPKVMTNGLDRINSGIGYFDSNVVACCKFCNFAKSDRTEEDFIKWIRVLADRLPIITSRSMCIQISV